MSAGAGRGIALGLGAAALAAWLACAFWNSVKPLPPGTHVTSLAARLAESHVEFFDPRAPQGISALMHELNAVGHAVQAIVLDQCPLAPALAEALLLRKRQHPNLKVVLVTDPRGRAYGGTPAAVLGNLERAGIIVARVRLTRLRDPDPLYSSWWRLAVGWWDDPFEEPTAADTWTAALRNRNLQADERQLLAADDGAGGWVSIVASSAARGAVGVELRGHLAHDVVASELAIAAWSADDDRTPVAPPIEARGVGTIDARLLTEGAIQTALRDALAPTGSGDAIRIAVRGLEDRVLVTAVARAAAHGAHVQLLLDPALPATRAAAAELLRGGGPIEVRWQAGALRDPTGSTAAARFALIEHAGDAWLAVGSADLTRRSAADLNLTADVELRMPARAAPARAASAAFDGRWSAATAYATGADESRAAYWRYRLGEVTGSAIF